MKRVRVVVLNMRRMMHDIVLGILDSQPDIAVSSEQGDALQLQAIAQRQDADVVILEQRGRAGSAAYLGILAERPQLKVLTITDDGRETFLYELRPHEVALGQLSEAGLLEAVRGMSPER